MTNHTFNLHCQTHTRIAAIAACLWLSASLATAQDITSNLVGHWKLDETSGTSAADSSGSGRTGSLTGSPSWTSAGQIDGGLDFETTDGVDRVDIPAFDVSGSNLTLSAWVKIETPLNDSRVITKSEGTAASQQTWCMSVDETGEFDFRVTAGGVWRRLQVPGVVATNQWYHLAATYDGTTMRVYVDGAQVGSQTHSPGGAIDAAPTRAIALGDSPAGARPLDGVLDDVRVYERTLSGADIAALASPSATTYYVRTDGSNSNSGTGMAAGEAWATVAYAATQSLPAGSTVYVQAGTYAGTVVVNVDGAAGSPIKFIADTTGLVSGWSGGPVVLQASASGKALDIDSDDYVEFHGFTLEGDAGNDVVDIDYGTGVVIERCEIYGGIKGVEIDNGASATVVNCLIYGNAGTGIGVEDGTCAIWNSTIVDNGNDGVKLDTGSATVTNSIICNNAADGLDDNPGTMVHTYNVVFGNGDLDYEGTGASTGEINSDPLLSGGSSYRLTGSSPAIDAGTSAAGIAVDDLDGNLRPKGGAWDMGCYEGASLVGHWKLNETSGTTAVDSSGNGNDGARHGSGSWVSAVRGNGFGVDYSDGEDYIEIPNSPELQDVEKGDWTAAAWFKPNSAPPGTGSDNDAEYAILTKEGWHIGLTYTAEKRFSISHYLDGHVWSGTGTWDTTYEPGQFYHVVGVISKSNGTAKIYVNGEHTYTSNFTPGSTAQDNGTSPWRIGVASPGASSWSWAADGVIDDARLYGYALSDSEVAELYGLIGHWKLDETSGTTANDSSGVDNHGTHTGGVAVNSSGPYPGEGEVAADFDGANDHVNLPNMEVDFSDGFAAACWVKPDNTLASGTTEAVLGLSNGANVDEIWVGGVGIVGFQLYMTDTDDGSSLRTIEDNTDLVAGKWTHYVASVDSTGNATLYRDGIAVKSQNTSFPTSVLRTQTFIGTSPINDYFPGALHDVRLYNRPLSNEEVADIYGLVGHWKLDEASGTVAADSTTNGNDGTYTNGPTLSEAGIRKTAVEFDGIDDQVTLPTVNHDFSGGLTISAWVKPSATPSPYAAIASWSNGSTVDDIWLGWQPGYGLELFLTDTVGGASNAFAADYTELQPGTWEHCIATLDNAGNATLYRNGVVTATKVVGLPKNVSRVSNSIAHSVFNDEFPGVIDEVRLYNRPISATEAAELHGLLGHWKFDEGSGTTAADSSPLGNDATLSGATWTNSCEGGDAIAFNGVGGIAATNSDFSPPAKGSIAFWLRGAGTPDARGRVMGINADWEIRQETTGKLSFDLGASPFVGNEPFATEEVDEPDRWRHIIAMYDTADNTYEVYVNGELQASGVSPVNLVSQAPGVVSFGTRTGSTEYWEGGLRDFRIYNRWLSPEQVSQLYGSLGHWKLDETSGTVAADSSGADNDGTYVNAPTLGASSRYTAELGTAVTFDGTNRVEIPGLLGQPENVTISAWAKLDSPDVYGAELISIGNSFALRLDDGGNLASFIWNGTDHSTRTVHPVPFKGAGWHHFAAVFNDDDDLYELYVDGTLVDAITTTDSIVYSPGNNTYIAAHTNGPSDFDFSGSIDDVRVFGRPLCAGDVFNLFRDFRPNGVRIKQWVETR
ncbi:LamG-like jellyroll fold domain-containing protein [Adhaeretor mobilis]|nr:LamG-like jellyroll fold domain-containing protein [Adhaeretor mobilis]